MDIGRELRVIEVAEEEELEIEEVPVPAVPVNFEARRPAPLPDH